MPEGVNANFLWDSGASRESLKIEIYEITPYHTAPPAGLGYRFLCRRDSKRSYDGSETELNLVPGRCKVSALATVEEKRQF
jgi:hypothetical protein